MMDIVVKDNYTLVDEDNEPASSVPYGQMCRSKGFFTIIM